MYEKKWECEKEWEIEVDLPNNFQEDCLEL